MNLNNVDVSYLEDVNVGLYRQVLKNKTATIFFSKNKTFF